MEKLCQLMIAEFEPCVICMFEPELEMFAVPAVTLPPVGSVVGAMSASAGVKVQGSSAVPTAYASARGFVRSTRLVRATFTGFRERVLRELVRFVVAM